MLENLVLLYFPVVTQEKLANSICAMSIHRRIKTRREALELSMEALAHRVGVVWQTVQQWEKEPGGTAPNRNRLERVAVALSTTPEYLLFGDETQNQGEMLDMGGLSQAAKDVIEAIVRSDKAGEPAQTFKLMLRMLPGAEEPLGRLNP